MRWLSDTGQAAGLGPYLCVAVLRVRSFVRSSCYHLCIALYINDCMEVHSIAD